MDTRHTSSFYYSFTLYRYSPPPPRPPFSSGFLATVENSGDFKPKVKIGHNLLERFM